MVETYFFPQIKLLNNKEGSCKLIKIYLSSTQMEIMWTFCTMS